MSTMQAITASAKDWVAALTRLSPAMAGKKPISILYCVHVDPAAGVLSGYDYETSAVTALPEFDGIGAPFLVPYRWLLDGIRATTGRTKSALVTVTHDGKKITISACGYEIHADSQALDEYPEIPTVTPEVSSSFPAATFRAALRRAVVAASTDDTLPILNAVQIRLKSGAMELRATDRYRLVEDHVTGAGEGDAVFLLTRKAIKAIDRFLVGADVVIGVNDRHVVIKTEDATFTTLSVDGTYPAVQALFPVSTTASFEFDRAVLLESAKVAQRMNEKFLPCLVRMSDAGAEVTFNYGLFGPSKAPLASGGVVAGEKDDVHLPLNPNFLVETLQQIPTDLVRISYTTAAKPFMFSPAGLEVNDPESLKYLLMPVRMPS